MRIVIIGLSITSSWGNGHATTYRSLMRALCARGHEVLFLERDVPWYASQRDLPQPPYGRTALYGSLIDLRTYADAVADADLLIVGSYVPEGVAVIDWALGLAGGTTAFYDIDTPVTLAKLADGDHTYLAPGQIPRFDLYLSFTGGPTLATLEQRYGAARARPLYCSVDPEHYFPEPDEPRWDLGYMGTHSADRQPALEALLLTPARRRPGLRMAVAGPQYPPTIRWPSNVELIEHLAPGAHRGFYSRQRYTLNLTRAAMARSGYAPSVRLFEAAACATAIISDDWAGLDEFFTPGSEILIARRPGDVLGYLEELSDDTRRALGACARARVLAKHSSAQRAMALEGYVGEVQRFDTDVLPSRVTAPRS
jgi:spore maturation protein CgeB